MNAVSFLLLAAIIVVAFWILRKKIRRNRKYHGHCADCQSTDCQLRDIILKQKGNRTKKDDRTGPTGKDCQRR